MADQNELLSQYIQVRTLHNTKRVVSPYSIFPRKEEKFRICESRKQRRSQADSRPTSSGQKATFSSLRPTASLQNQTYVSSHIHVHFPWHRLATGPRCHSPSRRMCTTKSRPPASAVSPKPVYFCVGGTTASSEAGHIFQRRNLASFPWRWPPRRCIRGAISGLSSDPPHPQPISRREVSPGPGTLPTPPPLQKQNKSPALPLHKPTQHARHTATCTPSPNHFHHRQVSSHPSHHPPQHQTRRIRIPAQIRGPIRTRLHVATPVPTRRISQTPPCQTPSKHQVTGTSQANPSQARMHAGR